LIVWVRSHGLVINRDSKFRLMRLKIRTLIDKSNYDYELPWYFPMKIIQNDVRLPSIGTVVWVYLPRHCPNKGGLYSLEPLFAGDIIG